VYPSFVAVDTYIDGGTPYRRKISRPSHRPSTASPIYTFIDGMALRKCTCRKNVPGINVNFPFYSNQYPIEEFFGINITLALVAEKSLFKQKVRYL